MSTPEGIDRIAPTLRPTGSPIMKQTWSDLLFLHWRVSAKELRPLVPERLEIDTLHGEAWVGLVPFTVSGARPRFVPPLPFVSSFHEVNVRTYVHHQGRDPGVWFFSLDAANRLVVKAAKILYHLPYRYADIDLTVQEHTEVPTEPKPRRLHFVSRRQADMPPDVDVRYGPGDVPRPAPPGTLEHFLAERYVLYATHERRLFRARVHHVPYPLQPGVVEHLRERLVAAAQIQRPDSEPLAHYAAGVDVDIWPLEEVE